MKKSIVKLYMVFSSKINKRRVSPRTLYPFQNTTKETMSVIMTMVKNRKETCKIRDVAFGLLANVQGNK